MYDITCTVADTSGEVFYNWSSDDGEISGEGSVITWTAPNTSRKPLPAGREPQDPTLTVIFLLQLQTDHLAALGDAEM
jgi:hypothetical protein